MLVSATTLVSCLLLTAAEVLQTIDDSIPPLRRYTITYSNNRILDDRYKTLPLPASCTSSYYTELRKIVDAEVDLHDKAEYDVMIALTSWVHRQWKHHGGGIPGVGQTGLSVLMHARAGQQFNCDGYSLLLNDVLIAHGFVSRRIYLRTSEADYAGPGQGHVAVGVYSNQYRKWMFLDPQNDGRIIRKGKEPTDERPMTWYDALTDLITGRDTNVEYLSSIMSSDGYRKWLSKYDGFMSTPLYIDSNLVFVSLPADTSLRPYLTFQGLAENGTVFTYNRNSLYMPVNGVSLSFYSEQFIQFDSVVRKYDIDDHEEYIRYLPAFTPGPSYGVKLHHSLPWFSHYEVCLDSGPWIPITSDQFRIVFHEGINDLKVRGVNQAGVRGPHVRMEIRYE